MFKKRKKKPSQGKTIVIGTVQTKVQMADRFGMELVSFDHQKDLRVSTHDAVILALQKKTAVKLKDLRRFSPEVVKEDISNLCQQTLNSIASDLQPVILKITQSKSYFERKQKDFDKDRLLQKYEQQHIRGETQDLQDVQTELTAYLKAQKAQRHLLLEELKQLKHETNDYVFEKCNGETPQKAWYNN